MKRLLNAVTEQTFVLKETKSEIEKRSRPQNYKAEKEKPKTAVKKKTSRWARAKGERRKRLKTRRAQFGGARTQSYDFVVKALAAWRYSPRSGALSDQRHSVRLASSATLLKTLCWKQERKIVRYIVVAAAFFCLAAAQAPADEIDSYFACAHVPTPATCAQYQRALYCAHMTIVLMYRGIHNDTYPNPDKVLEAMQNVIDGSKQFQIAAAKQGCHVKHW